MFVLKETALVVRKIQSCTDQVFLTFDDGPDPQLTPQVLDLLREENAKATFFVIGDRAGHAPELVQRMLNEGHGVFSHSRDHDYAAYFSKEAALQHWVQSSLAQLGTLLKRPTFAFRPPAGVLTPPLLRLAAQSGTPLVLWNHRFFDTVFPWTTRKAQKSLDCMRPGDIILLHDKQKPARKDLFLETLRFFVRGLKAQSLKCEPLSDQMLKQEISLELEHRT